MEWVREKRLVTANGCGDLEESGGNVLKLTVVTAEQFREYIKTITLYILNG